VINSSYLQSDTARQRFLREARAAAALRHPNVASVFNLSTDQDNYFYASMTPFGANQNDPRTAIIHVQVIGFGRVSSADISAVLQSAAFELWRYCPRTQLHGIDVYYRPDHPQTDFQRKASGRIGIGLSARDTHWAQYGFQFAHEFCHALANYSNNRRQLMRYPRQANLWLEESLCETASLFALRAMSRSWQNAPPYPAWRSYAPWMNDYVERRLALIEHNLPAGTSFSVWFYQNQSALRQNSDMRDRNTIIATQLLPIFESQPRGWEAVAFLNRGSVNPEDRWRSVLSNGAPNARVIFVHLLPDWPQFSR